MANKGDSSGTPAAAKVVAGPRLTSMRVDSVRRGESGPYSRRRIVETLENDCGLKAELAEAFARRIEESIAEREKARITTGEIRSLVMEELRAGGFADAARRFGAFGPSHGQLHEYFKNDSRAGMPFAIETAIAADVFRSFALDCVHSSEITRAHLDGKIHIEGLAAPARNIAGTYAIESIKKYGIGHAAPARDARELTAHIAAFLNYVGARYEDSICLAFLNPLFAPVVAGMEYAEMRREAEAFIFAVSRVEFARRGSVVIDLHTGVPHCLRDAAAIGPGGAPTGKAYGDYSSASREFAWVLIDVLRDVLQEGNVAAPTCVLHVNSTSFTNPAENDLLRFACAAAAEVGAPGFRFDRASIKFVPCGEVKESSAPDLERLRAAVSGSVAINLPQAAYSTAGNVEDFWYELDRAADLAAQAGIERLNFMRASSPKDANSPSPEFAVGVTGLNECVERLTGRELHESEDAHAVGLRVLAFLEIKCRDLTKKFGMRFTLGEGSAGAARRFAEVDRARFGEAAKYVRGNEDTGTYYYTRGASLRTDAPAEVLRRILMESTFHRVLSARTEIALGGDDTDVSAESVARVVERTYYRTDSAHLAMRGDVSVCAICGGFRALAEVCSRCGTKEPHSEDLHGKAETTKKVKVIQPYLFPEMRE